MNNPTDYGNLAGMHFQYWPYNGRNSLDNTDKKTLSGIYLLPHFMASGQKFGLNVNGDCNGAGDCFGGSFLMTYANNSKALGDEGPHGVQARIDQQWTPWTITLGNPTKSTCAATSLAASVTKGTSPVTVAVSPATTNCAAGDQITVNLGGAHQENVKLTAVTGGGSPTITALFYSDHANGEALAPSTVIIDSSNTSMPASPLGQDRWWVDKDGTTYSTGTASAPGSVGATTVTGVGTTWTTSMVGGIAGQVGCIAFAKDTTDNPHTFKSWFPIATVTNNTHMELVSGITYTGAQSTAGNYEIKPCAMAANLLLDYSSPTQVTGVVLYSNPFPWTATHSAEQTIAPDSWVQKVVSANYNASGPQAGYPDMFRAQNSGYQPASTALRIIGDLDGTSDHRSLYQNLIIDESNYLRSAFSIQGRSLNGGDGSDPTQRGSAFALGTFDSFFDPKMIAWAPVGGDGVGFAKIYPDTSNGNFKLNTYSAKLSLESDHTMGTNKAIIDFGSMTGVRTFELPDVQNNSPTIMAMYGGMTNGHIPVYLTAGNAFIDGGVPLASPLTTKGDIWGFSSVNARFPISGHNGWVLTENSGATFGYEWAAAGGGGGTIATTLTVLAGDNAGNAAATDITRATAMIAVGTGAAPDASYDGILDIGGTAYYKARQSNIPTVREWGGFWSNNGGYGHASYQQYVATSGTKLYGTFLSDNGCAGVGDFSGLSAGFSCDTWNIAIGTSLSTTPIGMTLADSGADRLKVQMQTTDLANNLVAAQIGVNSNGDLELMSRGNNSGSIVRVWAGTASTAKENFNVTENGVVSLATAALQQVARTSDPGCTTTADIGKFWFDNTTTTTAAKKCVNVAGTLTWVAF